MTRSFQPSGPTSCINLRPNVHSSSGWVFYEVLPNAYVFVGKSITASMLLKSATDNASAVLIISARNASDAEIGAKSVIINSGGLFRVTYENIPANTVYLRIGIYARTGLDDTNEFNLTAAKLELGSVQTLAHQEGDTWVLNEIPNYAEQYAVCEQYSPSTGEFIGSQHSNQNLLDNWYFVNPVNRNGNTEYKGIKTGIDRWASNSSYLTVKATDTGISITNTSSSTGYYRQNLKHNISAKKVTMSVLVSSIYNNSSVNSSFYLCYTDATFSPFVLLPKEGFFTNTIEIPDGKEVFRVQFNIPAGETVIISAVKLELGEQQTLVHQDEDGNWVLNEIPNYAEQYAICSQYSPITGEFVGSQYSNQNLLDNAYLAGGGSQQGGGQLPINQRNETKYTGAGYTIDRWAIRRNTTMEVNEDGAVLTLEANSSVDSGNGGVTQSLPSPENLVGKTVTASILVDENSVIDAENLAFGLWLANNSRNHTDAVKTISIIGKTGLCSFTTTITSLKSYQYLNFGVFGKIAAGSLKIRAAKLELGSVQTLAHKEGDTWVLNDPPPNYALELAKCQRYYYCDFNKYNTTYVLYGTGIASRSTDMYLQITIPVPMRATPTISTPSPDCLMYSKTIATAGARTDGISLFSVESNRRMVLKLTGTFEAGAGYNVYQTPESYIGFSADL